METLNTPPFFDQPPTRVVSLVPSLTESLFDLGLGDHLVGRTDFCIHPGGKVSSLPALGGTKNPRVDEILALEPELILANQEENSRESVEALERAGVPIWVSFTKNVVECFEMLRQLAGIFQAPAAFITIDGLERGMEYLEADTGAGPKLDYFCPIWVSETENGDPWWMTFNQDTYPDDLLRRMGGRNCFENRQRLYPLEADLGLVDPVDAQGRDTRYPHVTRGEIEKADPALVLLPSEPYAFTEADRLEYIRSFPECQAAKSGNVHLVDGSLLTWHGTRLAKAIRELPRYFDPAA